MAYDRNPLLTDLADKFAVRDYVSGRIGSDYLAKLYLVTDDVSKITLTGIPRNFVCQANHSSGMNVIVWDGADQEVFLPKDIETYNGGNFVIHPNNLDVDDLKALCKRWMNKNFYYTPGSRPAWCYLNIQPKVIFEELLLTPHGEIPMDYKFFMFDGECELVQVDAESFTEHQRDLFKPNWEKVPATYRYPNSTLDIPKPPNLERMLEIAGVLSKGLDFERVDLYDLGDRVVFGEITHYPEAGFEELHPRAFENTVGKNWKPNYRSK